MTNNRFMRFLTPVLRLVVIAAVVSIPNLRATQVILNNSTFAALPTGGLAYGCGSGCAYDQDVPIAGWTESGYGTYGLFQPGTSSGNDTYFNSMPNGSTNAFSFGPALSQTVNTTVQVGTVYTLTVSLGARNDYAFAGAADLLVNGVTYAATGTQPTPGQWSTFTVTYVGLAVDMGDSITIQLTDPNGGAANFGDVQFDDSSASSSSAVSEPRLTGCLGISLFGLLGLYRRKFYTALKAQS